MSEPTARDYDNLANALRDLNGTITALRQEMSATYVRKDVLEPQLKALVTADATLATEVKRHADWLTWAQRLVIGTVILAVLALVVVQTGVRP